jgi:prephenate dehydrogenase
MKLVVVGVGLIGGSFALALKGAGRVDTVVGVGRGRANLDVAQELGIIDRGVTRDAAWTSEVADADFVLVATPVGEFPAVFSALARALAPNTIVTDAGSTKQNVIAAARATFGDALPRFVPAHPIAGTENTGAGAAFATLFNDRNVVLTPLPETDPAAQKVVADLWRACGANVRVLDAEVHDSILAGVSHLPHILAFALVDMLARRSDRALLFQYAASGFRDFTRIAASSPEMWRDIALANRDALLAGVDQFRSELDAIAKMLRAADASALESVFTNASLARREWGANFAGTSATNAQQSGARRRRL